MIDGHLHVFLSHSRRYPRVVDTLAPTERAAPVEEMLATLDRNGVERAVIVPLGPEDDYLAECLRRWADRLVGVAVADEASTGRVPGVDPVHRLESRRAIAPFHGLRMSWLGDPNKPLLQSPALPLLRYLEAEELVVWFYAPPEQLPLLRQTLELLPKLQVVLNHLGFCPTGMRVDRHRRPQIDIPLPPATLPTILALADHPNVHVMVSGEYAFSRHGPPYQDMRPVVGPLYETFGADRMLWASDYPWTRDVPGYDWLLRLPDQHLPYLTAGERTDILGGTALRLFRKAWQK